MKRYKTVAALLASPKRWTKRTLARDARSRPVGSLDPEAVRYCLLGALLRVYPSYQARRSATNRLHRLLRTRCLPTDEAEFNDCAGRRHAEVLEVVRAAGI